MQSYSKQIGTLPGYHNQPGGPATERKNMIIRKKLVKEIKKTNPALAAEIKDMPVKEFKMLMFVFNVWCRL